MRKIIWPDGHDFAFTIVDDTDGATYENIKPVYDYLLKNNIFTTKTCWVYPPRDEVYKGDCFENEDYLNYLKFLKSKGFEIAFHNAGSGGFKREETLRALELFKEHFGEYPNMHINHSNNTENIYWGKERFASNIVRSIYSIRQKQIKSLGTDPESDSFWGDFVKENIKYVRNRTFNGINTLKEDPRLVYPESKKQKYANYWFSSSDGMNVKAFSRLLTKDNIDKLVKEKGCCILYTHFAYGFVEEDGTLNSSFKEAIDYIASKNGWFVPASTLLDYCLKDKAYAPSRAYEIRKDYRWLIQRFFKK